MNSGCETHFRSESGLTLVELVLALTILAVMSATLLGAISFGGTAQKTVAERSKKHTAIISTHRFLRTQISSAITPMQMGTDTSSTNAGAGTGDHVFLGDPRSLAFTAPWLTYIGQGNLFVFNLHRKSDELIISWRPANPTDRERRSEETETIGSRVLMSSVSDFSIEYFGSRDLGGDPNWHSSWKEVSRLPNLLRIKVVFSDENPIVWPELLVGLAS